MKIGISITVLSLLVLGCAQHASTATSNKFQMEIKGDDRCFTSNGIPDHTTGNFPRRGNPNAISEQDIYVCVPLKPKKTQNLTKIRGTVGIAVNGVLFRPNTAGFWDPDARRGHSRHGDRNWSLDIFGARGRLGLDFNNAHVGRGGLYHYHGIARSLMKTSGSSLVGYAGDGFEMHYRPNGKPSGWALKKGQRPSGGPPGQYDGMFNEDYEFVGGSEKLDRCNGGTLNGKYVYFVTDSYPFLPRCLYGEVSSDFNRSRHR
ncbi:MAG: YHYH protein [Rhodospirillaceae bacterium]|nr:YHYH protein [Rhodospirillaceae bacterium]|tara:strand:+ start:5276 stop:6055 length:780 start_codon:yes stop_codon:yes gene_type:complete